MIAKIATLKELDEMLPMIQEAHESKYFKFYDQYTYSGFVHYLVNNLWSPYFGIFKITESDEIVGYFILETISRFLTKECLVLESFMTKNDGLLSDEGHDFAVAWAKEQGCEHISCYTVRDDAIKRKWDFNNVSSFMIKKLEV
jgi:hypothetical protein